MSEGGDDSLDVENHILEIPRRWVRKGSEGRKHTVMFNTHQGDAAHSKQADKCLREIKI